MARMRLKRSRDFETSLLSFGQAAPMARAAAVPVPVSVRGRVPATVSAPACGPDGARPHLVRHRGCPFPNEADNPI